VFLPVPLDRWRFTAGRPPSDDPDLDHLAPPLPSGIFLVSLEEMPHSSPGCAVCGEQLLASSSVHCLACEAPHHSECWLYNQRCATYACTSRTAKVPPTGLRRSWFGDVVVPYRQITTLEGSLETSCPVCSRGWKTEAAVRCSSCSDHYHEACWQGTNGCGKYACRQAMKKFPRAKGPVLLLGAGQGNCHVCEGDNPSPTSMQCPSCDRDYHQGCWVANRGCLRFSCRKSPPDEKKAA
jgi:hypothetical protein